MRRSWSRRRIVVTAIVAVLILLMLRSCSQGDPEETPQILTISRSMETSEIKEKIQGNEVVQQQWFFGLSMLLHGGYWRVKPGGFRITESMGSWALAGQLTGDPPLHWVTIPPGLRKEQVADRLQTALGWDDDKKELFLKPSIQTPYDLSEGFYFPDTYLIPTDESDTQVTKRFINRFNENFDPLLPAYREDNIKFDTAVKLASIIQREAGGKSDMPLIAGILWNRLLQKMPLEVDATLQYARGDTGSGYWAPINKYDKQIDSPFNTYKNPGLPPQPISNPGLDALDAVVHSEDTPCIFYIHDNDRQIHCSETYEGHLDNIDRYLRQH